MVDTTIVSGGSFDLTMPLTGGTNIDFLNDPTASGLLRIEPSAFENLTVVAVGSTAVSTYLGGGIENFQSGDTIVIASLATAYAAFDHAPAGVTLAQNAAVASALSDVLLVENFIGPEIITISSTGAITDNTGLLEGQTLSIFGEHFSIPASIIGYIDSYATSIDQALFPGATLDGSVFINIGPDAGDPSMADATITTDGTETIICYLAGTNIATPSGEVAIEALRIGDPVITHFGGAQNIKWIGRQSFSRRFVEKDPARLPVCIGAGALGDGVPHRPLYVSPGHSMLLGGRLVLASALVNGVTITQTSAPRDMHYYQLEFAAHDCVLAEGSWSESYADAKGMRNQFHNAAAFADLYPDDRAPAAPKLCAPRPQRGARLAEIVAPVVARAAARVTPGRLYGWIDRIDPDGFISGWAQDRRNPDLPVLLEVLLDGQRLRTVLACDYRGDLAEAGIGHGACSFAFLAGVALPPGSAHTVQIRRASDGAELAFSAACRERLGLDGEAVRLHA